MSIPYRILIAQAKRELAVSKHRSATYRDMIRRRLRALEVAAQIKREVKAA